MKITKAHPHPKCRRALHPLVLADALEERRLFAGGFPGIPLVSAVLGIPQQAPAPTSTLSYPLSDIRNAAVNGAQNFTNYVKLNSGGSSPAITPYAGTYPAGATTPAQMRAAYGLSSVSFSGVTGNGAGETIAIVDAYDDPALVSSTAANWKTSDLYLFDQYTGLNSYASSTPPTFTKLSQTGTTSYPSSGVANGWTGEIILDVEWAHVMAPMANIVLFEASNAGNGLYTAVQTARNYPGVVAVTMSWGGSESGSQTSLDSSTFTSLSGHPVTFLASTGDNGANGQINPSAGSYPSFSPNVIGVGGTHLNLSGLSYSSETPYNDGSNGGAGGGGYSSVEPLTSAPYQTLITTPTAYSNRMNPDISIDAAPSSGVWTYDSTAGGWTGVWGGTSLASPMWAGIIAVVDQGRASLGLPALSSSGNNTGTLTGTLTRLYELPASDYHDVTTGNNSLSTGSNYTATVGYDLATGRGSPAGAKTVLDLAGGVTFNGTVYSDNTSSGSLAAGDAGISGVKVYLDLYNGSTLVSEVSTTTNSSGQYSFADLVGGATFKIRVGTTPTGYLSLVSPTVTATGSFGATVTNNFGFFPTTFTGSAFTVQLDPTATNELIYTSAAATGSPTYSVARSNITSLAFTGVAGADVFNVDLTNGSPLTGLTLTYNGSTSATAATVAVTGSTAANTVAYSSSSVTVDGKALAYSNVQSRAYVGGGGADALTLSTTSATLSGSIALQSLNLTGASKATLAPGNNTLATSGLSVAAASTLDLTDGLMIYQYTGASPISSVYALVSSAYSGGTWAGKGITSSAAATNSLTGLAVAEASDILGISGAQTGSYQGNTVTATTLLVRYTYRGDTNLDGQVDGSDVANALAGLNGGLTGWVNGDTDYSGTVTSSDYSTLLNSLRLQGPPIT